MKHFDRLFNMVMEEVKSSKLQRRGHIVSEGKCSELRKLHCITVGQAKAQLANLDPNTELYVHSIDENGETWDDCVVMGFEDWSEDYAVIDRDMFDHKAMTAGELLNNLQNIPDNRFFASLAYATYAHKPDYVKEIQPDGTIIVDMAWFPYNGEEGAPCRLDVQSVKVDESKKVIKESARRHARRHLIKEDRLTQDQWLDMLQEKFDGVVKGLLEKYPNDVINSIDTSYFSSDPEDNACQILDGLFVDLIDRFPQNLLTERDKKWIGKYDAQWEGCEGLWSDYCWGGNDVGAYKDLRAKFPVLADFVDKWVAEHPNEGTNAKYHITDPRAKNPPYPVAESVKKPVSKRRVIKESARRHVRRIKK